MRTFLKLAIAGLMALSLAGLSPANAGTAAGEWTSVVSISPGIIGTAPSAQTWTFGAVVLNGAFSSDDGAQQFGGLFFVDEMTMTRTSGGDLPDEKGIVNEFAWDTNEFEPPVGSLEDGTCKGTYSRLVTTVQITLNCSVTINGSSAFHSTISLATVLVPTAGDGALNRITQGVLVGGFHS